MQGGRSTDPVLRFHGAAHGVTGSCYEIETGDPASSSTAACSRVRNRNGS